MTNTIDIWEAVRAILDEDNSTTPTRLTAELLRRTGSDARTALPPALIVTLAYLSEGLMHWVARLEGGSPARPCSSTCPSARHSANVRGPPDGPDRISRIKPTFTPERDPRNA
jgi:hypothetical protein